MEAFKELGTFGEFEQLLKLNKRPILLSVYRDGCPICLGAATEKAIAARYSRKVALVKMSADDVPEIESKLNINLVPTLWLQVSKRQRTFSSVSKHDDVLRWLAEQLDEPPYR